MKALCIYCGANFNGDPVLTTAVTNLTAALARRQIKMVYGGGRVGVMGMLADEMLRNGGEVTGIIPRFLLDKEVGHTDLTELIVTENMHERKQRMADLAEGFMILPGGFGTLEEFFEVLTWLQLGLHNKPIGVLNIGGYYDNLFAQLDVMVSERYLKPANRALVLNEADPEVLLEKMMSFTASPDEVWFKDRNLT